MSNDDKVFEMHGRLDRVRWEYSEFKTGEILSLANDFLKALTNLRKRPGDALGFLAIKVMANQEEVTAGLAKALVILMDIAQDEKAAEARVNKMADKLAAAFANGEFTTVKLSDDLAGEKDKS